jgi:hypothetical protein
MVAKSYNNNIFKVITELDKKNYNFFKSYNEVQYKELQPYTLLRWLSAVQNESKDSTYYLNKTNELNEILFQLSDHKDLLLNLLCSIGSGHWVKHAWIQIPKGNKVNKDEEVVKSFYHYNDDEWNIKKQSISKEDTYAVYQYLGLKDKG